MIELYIRHGSSEAHIKFDAAQLVWLAVQVILLAGATWQQLPIN